MDLLDWVELVEKQQPGQQQGQQLQWSDLDAIGD
jgi:hypothetical protein